MTAEKPQDARAIANYILDIAPNYGVESITLMQLLKLVYLSHGWSLAFHDEPLIAQTPQAWQYGPVYPHIYKALSHCGGNPINERIVQKETQLVFAPHELTDRQKKVIDAVMQSYSTKHAFELSNITHKQGSPWDKAIKSRGVYKDILIADMRNYYKGLAEERGIKGL